MEQVLSLLCWKKKKSVSAEEQNQRRQTASQLLTDPSPHLAQQLGVSRARLMAEIHSWTLHTLLHQQSDMEEHWRLFHLSLLQTDRLVIASNAANQLLQAMLAALVKYNLPQLMSEILLRLFGIDIAAGGSLERISQMVPSFDVYKPSIDVLLTFLVGVVEVFDDYIVGSLQQLHDETVENYAKLMIIAMKLFEELCAGQSNSKKLFVATVNIIIPHVVRSNKCTLALKSNCEFWVNIEPYFAALGELNNSVLKRILFDANSLQDLSCSLHPLNEYLNDKSSKKQKVSNDKSNLDSNSSKNLSYHRNLFKVIVVVLEQECSSHTMTSLSKLLSFLAITFDQSSKSLLSIKDAEKNEIQIFRNRKRKKGSDISVHTNPSFLFWLELCRCVKDSCRIYGSAEHYDMYIYLIYPLFEVLANQEIYRVTDDNEDRDQFACLQNLVTDIVFLLKKKYELYTVDATSSTASLDYSHSVDLKLMCKVLTISPDLLQPHLEDVFSLFVAKLDKTDDKLACSEFFVQLVDTYHSMRLLGPLFEAFFESSKTVSEKSCLIFFEEPCVNSILRAFHSLPFGQISSFWIICNKYLSDDILKWSNHKEGSPVTTNIRFVRLCFNYFLLNIKISEQNMENIHDQMKITYSKVLSPVLHAINKDTDNLSRNSHVCGDVLNLLADLLIFSERIASEASIDFSSFFLQDLRLIEVLDYALPPRFSLDSDCGILESIAKLCGSTVRILVKQSGYLPLPSSKVSDVYKLVSFLTTYLLYHKEWKKFGPYLQYLDGYLSSKQSSLLVEQMIRSALNQQDSMDYFSDAAFFEISCFQKIFPSVCQKILLEEINAILSEFSLNCKIPGVLDNLQSVYGTSSFLKFIDAEISPSAHKEVSAETVRVRVTRLRNILRLFVSLPVMYFDECGICFCHSTIIACHCAIFKLYRFSIKSDFDEEASSLMLECMQSAYSWFEKYTFMLTSVLDVPEISNCFTHWLSSIIYQADMKVIRNGASLNNYCDVNEAFLSMLSTIIREYFNFSYNQFWLQSIFESITSNIFSSNSERITVCAAVSIDIISNYLTSSLLKAGADVNSNILYKTDIFAEKLVKFVLKVPSDPSSDFFLLFTALFNYYCSCSYSDMEEYRKKQNLVGKSDLVKLLPRVLTLCGNILALPISKVGKKEDTNLLTSVEYFFTSLCWKINHFTPTLSLPDFGRFVGVCLASLRVKDNLFTDAALGLLSCSTRSQYQLILRTILKEIEVNSTTERVLAALHFLSILLDSQKNINKRKTLQSFSSTMLESLVQHAAKSCCFEVKSGALSSIYRLSKQENSSWGLKEFQLVFFGLSPLQSIVNQRISPVSECIVAEIWSNTYKLLLRLLRHHSQSLSLYLPNFIGGCSALLQVITVESNRKHNVVGDKILVDWSANLSRLFGYMKPHGSLFKKYVVYLLAEYIQNMANGRLLVQVEQVLRPGVYELLDICSKYETEQLYTILDTTGKALLKTIDADYKLNHQYVGKV